MSSHEYKAENNEASAVSFKGFSKFLPKQHSKEKRTFHQYSNLRKTLLTLPCLASGTKERKRDDKNQGKKLKRIQMMTMVNDDD